MGPLTDQLLVVGRGRSRYGHVAVVVPTTVFQINAQAPATQSIIALDLVNLKLVTCSGLDSMHHLSERLFTKCPLLSECPTLSRKKPH